jgi:hypothetical protein
MPAVQDPLAHCWFTVHGWPPARRQWPAPSQVIVPEHTGFMSLLLSGMLVQVPALPGRAHDWQIPLHAVSQQ